MRTLIISFLVGILFASGGAIAGFAIGILLSYQDWLYKVGIDGPGAGVALVLLIFFLALVAGSFGFVFTFVRIRRRRNNSD
jgi:hypothetical protein